MSWNYRMMRFYEPKLKEYYTAIHEVYYTKEGKPHLYSATAATISTDENGVAYGLRRDLANIGKALEFPVLTPDDFTN